MSHPPTQLPESYGAQAPQVAVRDGDRLLCPCCGDVLMVLKAMPVGQSNSKKFWRPKMTPTKGDPRRTWPSLEKLVARQEAQEAGKFKAAQEEEAHVEQPQPERVETDEPGYRAEAIMVPIDPDIAAYEFPDQSPPKIKNFWEIKRERSPSTKTRDRPMRDVNIRSRERALRRLKQPPKEAWSYESARFHAWIYYRMKALNLQVMGEVCAKQEEIDTLKLQLEVVKQEQPKRARVRKAQSAHGTAKNVITQHDQHGKRGNEKPANAPSNIPSTTVTVESSPTQMRDTQECESQARRTRESGTRERGPP